MNSNNWISFFTEFIGTFIFVLVILKVGEPIPIGIALVAMIYFSSKLSLGAFNPAVATGLYLRHDLDTTGYLVYIVGQILGAVAAFHVYNYTAIKSE